VFQFLIFHQDLSPIHEHLREREGDEDLE